MRQATVGTALAGRYRLVEHLATGGMGTVWKGYDDTLDRPVAVKEVLLPPGLDDEARATMRRRTMREARAAARLRHSAIVTIYDVIEHDGRPWIVMELVVSQNLDEAIRTRGPIPAAQAAGIGLRILDALVTAEAAGVQHRDIKPANVLLAAGGRTVLTDFGIARHVEDETLSSAGLFVGSPNFLAPERARGQESPGMKADLWSLGATLYAAVEGRPPFERNGPLATLTAVVLEDPTPMQRAGPLQPVIDALLVKTPAQRLDADGVRRMLQQVLRGQPAERPRQPAPPTDREPADREPADREPADGDEVADEEVAAAYAALQAALGEIGTGPGTQTADTRATAGSSATTVEPSLPADVTPAPSSPPAEPAGQQLVAAASALAAPEPAPNTDRVAAAHGEPGAPERERPTIPAVAAEPGREADGGANGVSLIPGLSTRDDDRHRPGSVRRSVAAAAIVLLVAGLAAVIIPLAVGGDDRTTASDRGPAPATATATATAPMDPDRSGRASGVPSTTTTMTPPTPPTPPTLPTRPPTTPPTTPPSGNLARGRPITATGFADVYRPQNANDGNPSTYWESTNNAFPQSSTVDLGSTRSISRVVLKLPPAALWEARTQTLSLSGSTDGSAFSAITGSAGVRFDPATSNTAALNFAATSRRWVRVTITANTGWPAGQLSELEVYASGGGLTPPPGDLAAGHRATASGFADVYRPANMTDRNASTYWESTNNAFPQWAQVDLGTATSVRRLVFKLPPAVGWGARTQTLSVSGSTDGSSFSAIVGSAAYQFDAESGNTVTVTFGATTRRWLRVTFTANTGWPAGQLSSFEVYAS